jgi:hypothetical protein
MESHKDKDANQFVNPIDSDSVAENPAFLPYAHTVGGAVIRPEDKGKLQGRSITAMEQQTQRQMQQIYEQMDLLAKQAKTLQSRVEISYKIYLAGLSFEPVIGQVYYFYQRGNGSHMVSMISPEEWGRSLQKPECLAKIQLLGDHTWDVLTTYAEGL